MNKTNKKSQNRRKSTAHLVGSILWLDASLIERKNHGRAL